VEEQGVLRSKLGFSKYGGMMKQGGGRADG